MNYTRRNAKDTTKPGNAEKKVEVMGMNALERAKILLKAKRDILEKCNDSFYVLNVLEVTAVWDGVECDGYCLKDDIDDFFEEFGD